LIWRWGLVRRMMRIQNWMKLSGLKMSMSSSATVSARALTLEDYLAASHLVVTLE
jgi:regulator of sigma D